MKTYIPRPGDVAMDLKRCFEICSASSSFKGETFNVFLSHALRDLEKISTGLSKNTLQNVKKCLRRVIDEKTEVHKRKEDLLTASDLLLHSKI